MKSLIFSLFLMLYHPPIFIEGRNYHGYIFSAEEFAFVTIENQNSRYTPTNGDIELAEKLVKEKIACVNKDLLNQSDGCPKIHKKLKKYVRQYVGFINNNEQKVIWINFVWEGSIPNEKLTQDIIQVFDGCSYYWSIMVNLDSKNVYDLNVNGKG